MVRYNIQTTHMPLSSRSHFSISMTVVNYKNMKKKTSCKLSVSVCVCAHVMALTKSLLSILRMHFTW